MPAIRNNTGVFKSEYASIYDSLYLGKDYEKESDFIETIFNKYDKNVKTVLDLGCGTGGHALVLAKRGYKVTGVDRSEDMLRAAKNKAEKAGIKANFHKSSIEDLQLNKKYDAVISMFAVMSYHTDNYDLAAACKKAKQHLKSGGLFIFDAWNGLAVITDPPTQVIKEVTVDGERIFRFTFPQIDVINHTVDVNFRVLKLHKDRLKSDTAETHKVRFFYPQEIKYFLQVAGFKDIQFCPFLKFGSPLSMYDRDITVIAK